MGAAFCLAALKGKSCLPYIENNHRRSTSSLQAGSHLGAHARAAKSEFESEAILREESGDEAERK